MTKGYYYGKVVKAPTKKTTKKNNGRWDSQEWNNYEHQKHLNKLAGIEERAIFFYPGALVRELHGELVDKIVRMHKQSKQMSAFDQYEEDFDK